MKLAPRSVMDGAPLRPTCYTELGIPRRASQKDVERAFWGWREKWRRGEVREEELRRAESAYLTLSDPRRRRQYDRRIGCERHPAWAVHSPSRASSARSSYRRCLEHKKRGDYRKALRFARRAAALDPGCARCWSTLGLLVALTGGCLREAVRHGQRAWELEPGEPGITRDLALLYERAGLRKRARSLRRRGGGVLRPLLPSSFRRRS